MGGGGSQRDGLAQSETYALLEQRVEERTRELRTLLELSHDVGTTRQLQPLLSLVLDRLRTVVGYTVASIVVRADDAFEVLDSRGPDGRATDAAGMRFPAQAAGRLWDSLRQRSPLIVADVRGDSPAARAYREVLGAHLQAAPFRDVRSWMAVPLAVRDRVLGMLTCSWDEPGYFHERHVELALGFAAHAAVAIENASLHEQAAQRLHHLEVLYEADERLHHSLDLRTVFEALVEVAHGIMRADTTALFVWDQRRERLVMAAHRGWKVAHVGDISFAPGEHNVGWVAQTGEALFIEDLASNPRAYRPVVDREGLRSCAHVPIRANGEVLGVFNVNYLAPRTFSDADRRLVLALARRAALAIENARLYEESERRARELEALYRADAVLLSSLRLDDVLRALVDVAASILRADKSAVLVWDERRERLVVGATHGFGPEMATFSLERGQGIEGAAVESGEPLVVEDVGADPRVVRDVAERERLRSLMAVPMKVGGEVFGVFNISFCQPHRFTAEEQRLVLSLAQRTALAIENARLYGQAQQAAALEERQRLARELHDSVSQILFSAGLIAEVLPQLWRTDPDEGQRRLEELRQLGRGALAEMRLLLLELRPAALAEASLGDLLRHLAASTTGRARLPVTLSIDGDERCPLPPDAKLVLYRIVQEALHNTVKHAAATQATVGLACAPAVVEVQVSDDGRGFDPGAVPPDHLGLAIMRERARSVGAELAVDSAPGRGTRVAVAWPRQAASPVSAAGGRPATTTGSQ